MTKVCLLFYQAKNKQVNAKVPAYIIQGVLSNYDKSIPRTFNTLYPEDLTCRPLLVSVDFMRIKKPRSGGSSAGE